MNTFQIMAIISIIIAAIIIIIIAVIIIIIIAVIVFTNTIAWLIYTKGPVHPEDSKTASVQPFDITDVVVPVNIL